MTETEARAVQAILQTPGWAVIKRLANEEIDEAKGALYRLMHSYPDKLTGKSALKYAIRARALEDFLESVEDSRKVVSS